jgi:hypothetical protein
MFNALKLFSGEFVEVRSKKEILSTLDEQGCYENMPFMLEMFQYCGRHIRVYKRAHKTCDFVTNTGVRSLKDAVILDDIRCDGTAHGNCEALCTIFWKEVWLKRVQRSNDIKKGQNINIHAISEGKRKKEDICTEEMLIKTCCLNSDSESELIYRCQATMLPNYSQPLSPFSIRPYIEDYRSGNVKTIRQMLPRFAYRGYDNLINAGVGLGPILRWVYDCFQKIRGGQIYPARTGIIPAGSKTPAAMQALQPGEMVRVKSYEDILKTIDTSSANRGLRFSPEMVPYCGKVMRVMKRVNRAIDEKSGKMLHFKNPCIILEGGICQALYNKRMLFCPRATFAWWREIWLERLRDEKIE